MLNKTQVSNIAFEVPVYKLKVFSGSKNFFGGYGDNDSYGVVRSCTELYGSMAITESLALVFAVA